MFMFAKTKEKIACFQGTTYQVALPVVCLFETSGLFTCAVCITFKYLYNCTIVSPSFSYDCVRVQIYFRLGSPFAVSMGAHYCAICRQTTFDGKGHIFGKSHQSRLRVVLHKFIEKVVDWAHTLQVLIQCIMCSVFHVKADHIPYR